MKKVHYEYNQIQRWCNRIAMDILKSGWRPDYVVGITRGGLVPGVILSHMLGVPMNTLKVALRDDDQDCEHNCWMPEDVVNDKNILIVDDINDTGETLKWIREDWDKSVNQGNIAGRWHKQVKVAVIINNLASDEQVDWCAMDINKVDDPCWIVFPWESN